VATSEFCPPLPTCALHKLGWLAGVLRTCPHVIGTAVRDPQETLSARSDCVRRVCNSLAAVLALWLTLPLCQPLEGQPPIPGTGFHQRANHFHGTSSTSAHNWCRKSSKAALTSCARCCWTQWPAPSIRSTRFRPGTVFGKRSSAAFPNPRITPSSVPATNNAG
jgi:hypothetical protein